MLFSKAKSGFRFARFRQNLSSVNFPLHEDFNPFDLNSMRFVVKNYKFITI